MHTIRLDYDSWRADSGSESDLSGEGVSADPVQESGACMGGRIMCTGACPGSAASDNQNTNKTVTASEIDENGFCWINFSKCEVQQTSTQIYMHANYGYFTSIIYTEYIHACMC